MDDFSEPGKIVWHSSDPEAAPDVGRSIGLGNGQFLWFGEISRKRYEDAEKMPPLLEAQPELGSSFMALLRQKSSGRRWMDTSAKRF